MFNQELAWTNIEEFSKEVFSKLSLLNIFNQSQVHLLDLKEIA